MTTIKKIALVIASASSIPFLAFAASPSAPITTVQGLVNLICLAFDYMFYALIALSIVVVVIAGFNYVTSNGSSEKVAKANKMILYAVIGIAVALLAKAIPLIVGDFLGVNSGIASCGGGESVTSTINYPSQ